MDKQFLRSATFSKEAILENVYRPHNFNGEQAHRDVQALVHEERIRCYARRLTFFGLGGTLFSLYNVGRIAQLSPSGKPAAIGGVFFFAFLTYASASRYGFIGGNGTPAVEPATEEKK